MATVTLYQGFSFLAAQDWNWVVTSYSRSGLTISDGIHTQSFAGSFTYDARGNVYGTCTASNYYENGSLVYTSTGMTSDAHQLQIHAYTFGDTQQSYAYVLQGNDTIYGSSASDTIVSYGGNDILNGNGGADMLYGRGGDDSIDGGIGIDTSAYNGQRSASTVTRTATGWTVSSDAEGSDALVNVERLKFADLSVALDLAGSAGLVAKTLGAVFGSASVANEAYAGIGLYHVDAGMNYESLMQLAIDARLGTGASHTAVVELLYSNVVGSPPSAGERDYYVSLLDGGAYTVAGLGVMAADTDINQANINLVGLEQQGLEFVPFVG